MFESHRIHAMLNTFLYWLTCNQTILGVVAVDLYAGKKLHYIAAVFLCISICCRWVAASHFD